MAKVRRLGSCVQFSSVMIVEGEYEFEEVFIVQTTNSNIQVRWRETLPNGQPGRYYNIFLPPETKVVEGNYRPSKAIASVRPVGALPLFD